MPIQILSPQLANQIAAGEVVERPASVVKELVENSLDAGANRIQIDIENGGASLIKIRDNGIGIPKHELSLALARHATSKIANIEDLESILSLGFRGEALASISSVSRLTLTSRTADQNEAWQVYVQGREQESHIQPASHPVGTTVEVANLFFNTPARRKFLRSDKTEFAHIDEVIRRIALAKPQISFTLTHNGKTVRQYKSAVQTAQVLKRVAAICGDDFVQHALHIDWKHDDLHLSGWVAAPQFYRTQNDLAYCYINGRMVKDKVITHAIRQAYANYLHSEQYPAFVLFLDLNPNEVDVNVHPTKHEVRFHQSRLIHDFICQGVENALSSAEQLDFSAAAEQHNETQEPQAHYVAQKPNRAAAGHNIFTSGANPSAYGSHSTHHYDKAPYISKSEQKAYGELLKTDNTPSSSPPINVVATQEIVQQHMLKALALVDNQALLLQQNTQFYLLSIKQLQQTNIQLSLKSKQISQQPLLIPVVFRLNEQLQQQWQQQKPLFAELGFEFVENVAQQRLTLNKVPQCLRQQNLQKIVMGLLQNNYPKIEPFCTALLSLLEFPNIEVFAQAVNLLQEVELQLNQQSLNLLDFAIQVDFSHYLAQLNRDES
ncbi:DNA mismatch repair endonuclease MutL [Pasteurellaceae bacterium 22721_9_1]